jgi:dipeptidyl aminopeptidase/acylaminoacyl peptidase
MILGCSFVFAQDKALDSSVYDDWRIIKKFGISDDGNIVFTVYESHNTKSLLDIRINDIGYTSSYEGMSVPEFAAGQSFLTFKKKDTLYLFDAGTAVIDTVAGISKEKVYQDNEYITFFKPSKVLNVMDIRSGSVISVEPGDGAVVSDYEFLPSGALMLLVANEDNENVQNHFLHYDLESEWPVQPDTVYSSCRLISSFNVDDKKDEIIFFSTSDTSGIEDVKAEIIFRNRKMLGRKRPLFLHEEIGLGDHLLPRETKFNLKKGIAFSDDDTHYTFEINPLEDEAEDDDDKVEKPPFEYELWRWNDTLLPTQKRSRRSVFADNIKCIFRPDSKEFVQLSHGKGVFLKMNDSSLFGIEIDSSPYLFEDMWRDPLPKDYYITNSLTGEHRMLFEGFEGSFFLSPVTPHIFTYEYDTNEWYAYDMENDTKVCLSEGMPYPVERQDFDKPQPAGAYGRAGMTEDLKYFLVYDEYDIWALPMDGNPNDIFCLTNEYGRENNIKFKVLNMSGSRAMNDLIDLEKEMILEAVDLDNMHSGFYALNKGEDPVKLLKGPYKYSYSRTLDDGSHVIVRESFDEAPDYWITDSRFSVEERLTSLNDQLNGYKTGRSRVIEWKDDEGSAQRGVLYTPQGYDPSKKYPAIVYFYETMTQDAFMFYTPEPTRSTINPLMFVSRGYVIFMPDIRYEIGWPGESSSRIVKSGTKHIIDEGIADPERIGVQGHSWGGYQVAYLITQTDLFKCACSETAVANMTSAYSGLRAGPGKTRMFMYESTQSRIGGDLWEKTRNYIENSPVFYLDNVTTPLLSRHSDGDEAVPFTQGLELFLGLKRLGKPVWMFNYKGDGHNIKKREIAEDWTRRMDQFFDYYLMDKQKPEWMK